MKHIEIRGYRISLRNPILRFALRKPIRIMKSPLRKAQETIRRFSEHERQMMIIQLSDIRHKVVRPQAERSQETKQLEEQYYATDPSTTLAGS